MTKPSLVKVRALFYVFQHVMRKGAAPILTQPLNPNDGQMTDWVNTISALRQQMLHHPSQRVANEYEILYVPYPETRSFDV